jgi:hypothetical protein
MLTSQYLPLWLDKRFTSLLTTHRVFPMPKNRLETQNIWRGSKTTHDRKHPPLLYINGDLKRIDTNGLRHDPDELQVLS